MRFQMVTSDELRKARIPRRIRKPILITLFVSMIYLTAGGMAFILWSYSESQIERTRGVGRQFFALWHEWMRQSYLFRPGLYVLILLFYVVLKLVTASYITSRISTLYQARRRRQVDIMVRQDAQRRKEDFEAERNQVSLVKISHSTALQRISNDLEALTAEEWDYLNRLIQDRKPT